MSPLIALVLPDARADGATRQVTLSPHGVIINRRFLGVAMRLVVPACAYHGIGLRRVASEGALRHEVALLHRDADLSVTLEGDASTVDAALACARWAQWFGLPALHGPEPGRAGLAAVAPKPRRRSAYLARRRRRYALRRKVGFVSQAFV